MAAKRKTQAGKMDTSTANLGFEAKLWLAADTATRMSASRNCAATWRDLREAQDHRSNNMDAAEYKHVVLGLIFLKYISDTFEEHRARLAAIRGFSADFGPEHADTFCRNLHPYLRADTAPRVSASSQPRSHLAGLLRSERQLLANPPFNDSDWFRKDDDVRWQFGVPPKGNPNFAWVHPFIHHLALGGAGTSGGMAGFVLANGSISSNQSGEGDISRTTKQSADEAESFIQTN